MTEAFMGAIVAGVVGLFWQFSAFQRRLTRLETLIIECQRYMKNGGSEHGKEMG